MYIIYISLSLIRNSKKLKAKLKVKLKAKLKAKEIRQGSAFGSL